MISPPNPKHWISQHNRLGLSSLIGQNGSKKPQIGALLRCVFPPNHHQLGLPSSRWPKWVKKTPIWALLGCVFPQTPNIGSPNTTGWVSHLSLAKMGQKTPKLGTFGVCFPPKPHTLDLPTPPVGSTIFHWPKWVKKTQIWGLLRGVFPPNTTTWVYFLPIGQNGSKNPKIGHF